MNDSRDRQMRVGVAGLGTASTELIPEIINHPNLFLAAGADLRPTALEAFNVATGARTYSDVREMCESDDIDAIYIATPNRFHCEHAIMAAEAGKDVIVEKPIALTLEECDQIIATAEQHQVRVLAGHTHSFDAPVEASRLLISDGIIGRVHTIQQWYFTDWMLRGRLPEELDTSLGGGVVFRQGPHGIDIVRLLAGSPVVRVLGQVTRLDPKHPTEGSYIAWLTFESGCVATLGFSGYGYFDSSELTFGIGETGARRDPEAHRRGWERNLGYVKPEDEWDYKDSMRFGGDAVGSWLKDAKTGPPEAHPFYGLTLVSGDSGDLRQSPDGLVVYDRSGKREIKVPRSALEREAELNVLYNAWRKNVPLESHDASWARDTLAVCLAILESADTGSSVEIRARASAHSS